MIRPVKPYILWVGNGNGQYVPKEFDTVEEVLLEEKYTSDWYITESVNEFGGIYSSYRIPKKPDEKPDVTP